MRSTPCSMNTLPPGHYRHDPKISLVTKTATSLTTDGAVRRSRAIYHPLRLVAPLAWDLMTTVDQGHPTATPTTIVHPAEDMDATEGHRLALTHREATRTAEVHLLNLEAQASGRIGSG